MLVKEDLQVGLESSMRSAMSEIMQNSLGDDQLQKGSYSALHKMFEKIFKRNLQDVSDVREVVSDDAAKEFARVFYKEFAEVFIDEFSTKMSKVIADQIDSYIKTGTVVVPGVPQAGIIQ